MPRSVQGRVMTDTEGLGPPDCKGKVGRRGWGGRDMSLERREEASMSYILSSWKKSQPWAVD